MKKESMDGVPKLDIDKYLSPLTINGLHGRMLHLPAPANKKREILSIYGHHASLERTFGMAQALNRYGAVTVPDLPGFGGMDSLFKIGKKPTLDNLADYLAAFIKMRYKKRHFTLIAVSMGFAVATRMLQKYPHMVDQVELCVSATGFTHRDDFKMSHRKKTFLTGFTRFMSWRGPGLVARAVLRKPVIRNMYKDNNLKAHSPDESPERRQYRIEFEVWLWQNNDIRTHFFTISQMLSMNLCAYNKVALPVYHVSVDADQYLDNHLIEQHMRVIYKDFNKMPLPHATVHAPTILANAKEAGAFIPSKLRSLLNQQ